MGLFTQIRVNIGLLRSELITVAHLGRSKYGKNPYKYPLIPNFAKFRRWFLSVSEILLAIIWVSQSHFPPSFKYVFQQTHSVTTPFFKSDSPQIPARFSPKFKPASLYTPVTFYIGPKTILSRFFISPTLLLVSIVHALAKMVRGDQVGYA